MSDTSFAALEAAARAEPPVAAIVLGSGMTGVASRIAVAARVPFAEVPGLAAPSVHGHAGALTLGQWGGRRVLIFQGRLHFYEGHSWDRVVQPVRLAADLGARVLLLTNAAGGIADPLEAGSLMAIRDHIEWTRPYWWRHPGPGGIGPSRPSPYAPRLLERLDIAARELGTTLHQGVYACLTGPCYETPAEIRALRTCGADAVGMSTAREAQTGCDLGMECAAVSFITNRAAGLSAGPLDHKEVLANAALGADRLTDLLERLIGLL